MKLTTCKLPGLPKRFSPFEMGREGVKVMHHSQKIIITVHLIMLCRFYNTIFFP